MCNVLQSRTAHITVCICLVCVCDDSKFAVYGCHAYEELLPSLQVNDNDDINGSGEDECDRNNDVDNNNDDDDIKPPSPPPQPPRRRTATAAAASTKTTHSNNTSNRGDNNN